MIPAWRGRVAAVLAGFSRPPALRVAWFGIALAMSPGLAAGQEAPALSAAFVQLATAGPTQAATVGVASNWDKAWPLGPGRVSGYWELSLAAWSYPAASGHGRAQLGQVAVTPMFRYTQTDGGSTWFIEAGIGATLMNTLYVTDSKAFSTRFNFGDQIGVGWIFGAAGEHQLTLRVQHFSNANIKFPNPGENFAQIRYTRSFP